MTSVQDRLDEAQSRIAEVPKRIQEALAPMSDAIYLFNEDLTTMSQVGDPPGQLSPPAPQAAEPAAAQAPADEHIVLRMDEKITDVLDKVGLKSKGFKMPFEFSGGEQQRVDIASALLNSPKLILADEPTGNLDPETSDEIMNLLFQYCQGF